MRSSSFSLRPAFLLFASSVLVFALVLVNGYGLSFIGLSPNAIFVFILSGLEFLAIAAWVLRRPVRIVGEPLEVAGFLLVFVGTWFYFINPSWPTLIPPTYSGDAAIHYSYINTTFASGHIIPDYPGGPAFMAAIMAQWIGWLPLRILHPLGACWIALTAGGIYGLACAMLRSGGVSKVVALLAPFALFISSDYFEGILIGPGYFWAQVAGQLFVIAFVWFLVEYLRAPHDAWSVAMALCLIGVSVSYPIWLALPVGLLGWMTLREWNKVGVWRSAIFVVGTLAVFWGLIVLVGREFIPKAAQFGTEGAAVVGPSFSALGGAYLILPALGLAIALRRRGGPNYLGAVFLLLTLLHTFGLFVGHLLFGLGTYWVVKSFFLWIFPLAVFAPLPIASALEWTLRSRRIPGPALVFGFAATALALVLIVAVDYPPTFVAPLDESEIQVALWARDHLKTHDVNYVSRKGLIPQWIGVGLWGESFPDDLWDQAQLGPKTFEEWRDDPSWGKYLFVASGQQFPPSPDLQTVYRYGNSMILKKPGADDSAVDMPTPVGRFGNALTLVDYDLPVQSFRAGDVISFTAQIRTQSVPAHQVVWRLQLRDLTHHAVAEVRIDPFGSKFPLQRWPDGRVVEQSFALSLPIDLRAGLYDLELGLYYVGNGSPLGYHSADGATDDIVPLGRIKIDLPSATTHELGAVRRLGFTVGDAISLLGYRLPAKSPIPPSGSIKVYLYWQDLASPPRDFTAFVHLLDAGGVLRAQSDAAPRGGTYPTSIWMPGEIIMDSRTLTLPPDAPPGDYHIEVGMYEWPSLTRLSIADAQHRSQGDHVVLPDVVRVIDR
jgi:hypothetical protein